MADHFKAGVIITDDGISNREIKDLISGQVTLDFPSAGVSAVVSASATVTGLDSNFKVIGMMASAWETLKPMSIVAAKASANAIIATAANCHSATVDAAAQDFAFMAFKPGRTTV